MSTEDISNPNAHKDVDTNTVYFDLNVQYSYCHGIGTLQQEMNDKFHS